MTDHRKQTNILVCGSPRVGKSTLINAILQQTLAKSSASLNTTTRTIERYSSASSVGKHAHETVIWDAPGIESWNENDVRTFIGSSIEQTKPLCVIYCASPGSFALVDQLTWLVSECDRQQILCALVCTNMWSGRNRKEIVQEFCRIVNRVHPNISGKQEDDQITYFDRVALVAMVNSLEYIDRDFDVSKPPAGVEEFIFGIAKSLRREQMFAWFRTVAQNSSFWSKMSSRLTDLLQIPGDALNSLCNGAEAVMDSLLDLDDDSDDSSLTDSHTEEKLFYDAEILEIPDETQYKKLRFTFKSADVTMMSELSQTLSNFGAIGCQTVQLNTESDQLFTVTATFENTTHIEAIHNLWRLATVTESHCTIVDETSYDSHL